MREHDALGASFGHALEGIVASVREGRNIRIQLAGGALALALGLLFQIEAHEWLAIIVCCGLVLGGECLNTALERTVDLAMPKQHPDAKVAKDAAAGAVLLFALASLAVGIVIFLPRILGALGIFGAIG